MTGATASPARRRPRRHHRFDQAARGRAGRLRGPRHPRPGDRAGAPASDLVGIMALVERPLAAVVAAPSIRTPRQLQGRLVGITGVPSDTAVLHSIVAGAGGDPRRVKTITIGFNAVPDLLAGRVSAATAFWNDEGVTLASKRPGFHSFRVEDYGAPGYPELVVTRHGAELRREPGLARALVRTLTQGYAFTLAHPAQSAGDLERLVSGLDPRLVSAQLAALLGAFRGPGGRVGALDPATLRRWAQLGGAVRDRQAAAGRGVAIRPALPVAARPAPPPPAPSASAARPGQGRPAGRAPERRPRRGSRTRASSAERARQLHARRRIGGQIEHEGVGGAQPRARAPQHRPRARAHGRPRSASPTTFEPNSRSGTNATTRATTARGSA